MKTISEPIAIGVCALSLAVTLASPADAAGCLHGPRFPGGQGGYHHPGSGFLDGAAGRHRGGCDQGVRGDRRSRWRGGFDGGGLY